MLDAAKYPLSTHGFNAEIVELEIEGVAIYRPFGEFRRAKIVLSPIWCSRATTGVHPAPCHDVFRGPRSDYVRQAFLSWASGLKNSPQSHIVRVYDAEHGESGVFHSAEWHDGDWMNAGGVAMALHLGDPK
ncbi:hypothetical protein TNCV_1759751 [Trichonephila clavipes]|nr:hypothetical protein TNCV_1759751 [Trichonephila clavipes]